jgi:hypothetical protein
MKAILIDSKNREIRQIEIDGSLRAIYDAIDVSMIEVATYLPNGDCVYCDEEGLLGLTPDTMFFDVKAHQPFAGNGLVIGTGRDGNSVSAKSTVESIDQLVSFKTIGQVRSEIGA